MKKILALSIAFTLIISVQDVMSQRVQKIPFGNMDRWQTRVVKESLLLGGNTKYLYDLAPTEVKEGEITYTRNNVSPWASSNVLASPAGIVKTSTSVFPEERGDGYCARLEVREERCKAIGIVNIVVVAPGSIFLGGMLEPVKSAKDPMKKLDQGIPFKKRPSALRFDYKTIRKHTLYKASGGTRITEVEGTDNAEVTMYLIHRWEDANGNIYAKRIGTVHEKYGKDVPNWVNGHTLEVRYGDITKEPYFKSYMDLLPLDKTYYTKNSKGDMVPVQEVGWGTPEDEVTHLIMRVSASDRGPYIGTVGSTFWIDNIEFLYY